jgi:hypothetical protein
MCRWCVNIKFICSALRYGVRQAVLPFSCLSGTINAGPHDARAHKIASAIAARYPGQYETWFYWTGTAQVPSAFAASQVLLFSLVSCATLCFRLQFFDYTTKKFEAVEFPAHLKVRLCWLLLIDLHRFLYWFHKCLFARVTRHTRFVGWRRAPTKPSNR